MKALSIVPDMAWYIWFEEKTIEIRTWQTQYRGDILICANREKIHGTIPAHAICVANVKNIRPLQKSDAVAGMFDPADFREGLYAWELDNIRTIKPVPVRGMPGFFDVDDSLIEYIPDPDSNDMDRWNEIWKPLMK